jgi:hypothetical protein
LLCLYAVRFAAQPSNSEIVCEVILKREEWNDYLWILSELLYYGGLLLSVFAVPALTFSLWMMSLVDEADPNFWYLLIAWVISVVMFFSGIGLKNRLR